LRVLTTIVLRLEGTLNGVLDQLHAMVSHINASTLAYAASRKSGRREPQLSPILRAAMKADCGISTLPNWRIRFLPSFCLSSSLRLRVTSPP